MPPEPATRHPSHPPHPPSIRRCYPAPLSQYHISQYHWSVTSLPPPRYGILHRSMLVMSLYGMFISRLMCNVCVRHVWHREGAWGGLCHVMCVTLDRVPESDRGSNARLFVQRAHEGESVELFCIVLFVSLQAQTCFNLCMHVCVSVAFFALSCGAVMRLCARVWLALLCVSFKFVSWADDASVSFFNCVLNVKYRQNIHSEDFRKHRQHI